MKSVTSMNNKKVDSPKTPGGISKSLLTPCRRVGLSRNWRRNGPSPFVSPLSGSVEAKPENRETCRKRKISCDEEKLGLNDIVSQKDEDKPLNNISNDIVSKYNEVDTIPKSVSIPQKKRSKTLITSKIDMNASEVQSPKTSLSVSLAHERDKVDNLKSNYDKVQQVTTLRTNSKSRSKKLIVESSKENTLKSDGVQENLEVCKSKKSPENLTKECIVVIQNKIFKKDLEKIKECNDVISVDTNTTSQILFDSDADDVPLSTLKKKDAEPKVELDVIAVDNNDDDFVDNNKVNVKKLTDKTTSTGSLQNKVKVKKKCNLIKEAKKSNDESAVATSQCSLEDDEDFVMDKRTILIRKSYDKITKPLKAKSTGSITQRDIDELKARIETKKKLLLAKAMTKDTEELRGLIKKWQKGCQDALAELMDLMRQKFPEKQYMDYSEILQTLKIPASMVGYDEENDSFVTPTDESIILSKYSNL